MVVLVQIWNELNDSEMTNFKEFYLSDNLHSKQALRRHSRTSPESGQKEIKEVLNSGKVKDDRRSTSQNHHSDAVQTSSPTKRIKLLSIQVKHSHLELLITWGLK